MEATWIGLLGFIVVISLWSHRRMIEDLQERNDKLVQFIQDNWKRGA